MREDVKKNNGIEILAPFFISLNSIRPGTNTPLFGIKC